MAALKDTINEMIRNLKDTGDAGRTREQDWLKTNLAKFSRMLQGQRDLADGNLTQRPCRPKLMVAALSELAPTPW